MGNSLVEIWINLTLSKQIKEKQLRDEKLIAKDQQIKQNRPSGFGLDVKRGLCFRKRLCVLNNTKLRQVILYEVHNSSYAMHSGGNKM